MRGSHLVVINGDRSLAIWANGMVNDTSFQKHQANGGYAASRWFECTEAPFVISIETTKPKGQVLGLITKASSVPLTKHVNEMLLSKIILLVDIPLQSSENITLFHEVLAAFPLNI